MSENKPILMLPLSKQAQMAVVEIRQKTGLSEADAVQKLLTWFTSQEAVLQSAILESKTANHSESAAAVQEIDLI